MSDLPIVSLVFFLIAESKGISLASLLAMHFHDLADSMYLEESFLSYTNQDQIIVGFQDSIENTPVEAASLAKFM